jgi:hypothetical protein
MAGWWVVSVPAQFKVAAVWNAVGSSVLSRMPRYYFDLQDGDGAHPDLG